MIELDTRPKPEGAAGAVCWIFNELDQAEVTKFKTWGDLAKYLGERDYDNLIRNFQMPDGLMVANLFFFLVRPKSTGDVILVDVDIELRPDCQSDGEMFLCSLTDLPLCDHEQINQIHDRAIDFYRGNVGTRIDLVSMESQ